jgi:hypothetical protein
MVNGETQIVLFENVTNSTLILETFFWQVLASQRMLRGTKRAKHRKQCCEH